MSIKLLNQVLHANFLYGSLFMTSVAVMRFFNLRLYFSESEDVSKLQDALLTLRQPKPPYTYLNFHNKLTIFNLVPSTFVLMFRILGKFLGLVDFFPYTDPETSPR